MSIRPRIMVVEDERDLLRLVELYLKAWKFDVDPFHDPVEALTAFQKNPALFSLVLTDISMPGMSGIELARNILKIKPDAKVLLMTAYDVVQEELEIDLPVISHQEILKKPFRLVEICNAVKRQLQIA